MQIQSKLKSNEVRTNLWKVVQNASAIKFYTDVLFDEELKGVAPLIRELAVTSDTVLDKVLDLVAVRRAKEDEELC